MTTDIHETTHLEIDHIGARGDGVSRLDGRAIHVPYVLPGEQVEVHERGARARLVAVTTPSADRIAPICPHFGVCGGCTLQHWAQGPQLAWKGELVTRALARHGLDYVLAPATPAWGNGRRRASFHAKLAPSGFVFGFSEFKSHALVDIERCPVLTPGFQDALPRLHLLAQALVRKGEGIDLAVTETPTGLDVDVRGGGSVSDLERRGLERLSQLAQQAGIGRLTLQGDTAIERSAPRVKMGRAIVSLPAGAFLQATKAGEDGLADRVLEWTHGAKKVADLFCGIGTFALRLKENAQVLAIESQAQAVAAMQQAADALAGGKTLQGVTRDLFRAPLTPHEMKGLDAIVFDPPRAGAQAQAVQIARSKVKTVVAISCDPVTFARDAEILVQGGYRLSACVAFDQFRFTSHVEIAAKFVRPSA